MKKDKKLTIIDETAKQEQPLTIKQVLLNPETYISAFIAAFFAVSALNLLIHLEDEVFYTSLEFMQAGGGTDLTLICIFTLILCVALVLLATFLRKINIVPNFLVCSASLLALLFMYKADNTNYYMLYAVLLIMAIVMVYATNKKCFSFIKADFPSWVLWVAVALIALVFGFFICAIGVYRYLTFSTPNFDFGLFCNMFYNMAESGLPNVTSERDMLLSHFAVHFSPIYYLMLPFYYIFRSPITLQILQGVVVYSGIIPAVLIARKLGLSRRSTLLVALLYAAYPALSAGCFYDLHENCFLTPLLLWVFYFFESKKYIPMALFAILVLFVKEDAFVYLVLFAIYLLLSRKNWKIGIPMFIIPLIYFFVVSSLMQQYGTGIMSGRFDNLIYNNEDGLVGVIKTIFANPGYAVSQLFKTNAGDTLKLKYLFQLMIPLGLFPFFTKKISRFLLLTPILINTLTLYKYQPDIGYQYSFGISAFLFYLAILNLSDMDDESFTKGFLSKFAVIAAVLLFVITVIPKYTTYTERYEKNKDLYARIEYALEEELPENASVTSTTWLLAHIADRDVIYEAKYHKDESTKEYKTDTEYIVLDMRSGYAQSSAEIAEFYISKGYVEHYRDDGAILILVDKDFKK